MDVRWNSGQTYSARRTFTELEEHAFSAAICGHRNALQNRLKGFRLSRWIWICLVRVLRRHS